MREETPGEGNSRRVVLAGAGVAGLAGVLAACGGSGGSSGAASSPADSGSGSAPASAGSGGGALAKTSDIPVGGGKIFDDQKVVVTQPTAGQFKAFSAICQHMGCTVGSVAGGTINCPCHGSKYKISDGSVVQGPAARALPAKHITTTNGEITLG
jgi:Rieske Fe-S protein